MLTLTFRQKFLSTPLDVVSIPQPGMACDVGATQTALPNPINRRYPGGRMMYRLLLWAVSRTLKGSFAFFPGE
jgi:hypothetical protein